MNVRLKYGIYYTILIYIRNFLKISRLVGKFRYCVVFFSFCSRNKEERAAKKDRKKRSEKRRRVGYIFVVFARSTEHWLWWSPLFLYMPFFLTSYHYYQQPILVAVLFVFYTENSFLVGRIFSWFAARSFCQLEKYWKWSLSLTWAKDIIFSYLLPFYKYVTVIIILIS